MYRLATTITKTLWTIGLLGFLAVGFQDVGQHPTSHAASPDTSVDEVSKLIQENQRLKQQIVDLAAQPQQASPVGAEPVVYGKDGRFVPAQVVTRRPYEQPRPRPRWRYREPTCAPSRAQIAWAKMLPNYNGLVSRGLSDQDIIQYFAPSEVKALEGEEVPEHLRPDTRPAVVFVNERCKDGTCTTGYCPASRNNLDCQGGVCRPRLR